MSAEPKKHPAPAADPARPATPHGSGEGATTALEALIRQRKLGHTPDEQRAGPPPAPAQEAC